MCAYSSAAQPALQVQVLQSACSAGCDVGDMVLLSFSFLQFSLPDCPSLAAINLKFLVRWQ